MNRWPTPAVQVAVAALAVAALAGCGSSGGKAGSQSSDAKSGSPKPSTSASSTPSPAGTAPDAATRQAITSAFTVFFGTSTTTPQSVAVLQHGSLFAKTITEQGKSSLADKSSAKVTAISVHGDVADVTFSILNNGTTLLQGFKGNAVREGGHWKVAAKTFCALLQLQGDAPAACAQPSVIALPD